MKAQGIKQEGDTHPSFDFLARVLDGDINTIRETSDETLSQTWRRAYCITLFNSLDTLIIQLHFDTIRLKKAGSYWNGGRILSLRVVQTPRAGQRP